MHHLTQAQLKAMLQEIYTARATVPKAGSKQEKAPKLDSLRRKALVLVTYWHGLRASEAIRLTGADIQGGHVAVKRLKGSDKTIQPFIEHDDADLDESTVLTELASRVKPRERVFPISRIAFYMLVRRAGERAGLPPHLCHPHVLKHTCAMVAIKSGINNAQKYLGHKSMASTGRYTMVGDREASRAFSKAARAIENVMED